MKSTIRITMPQSGNHATFENESQSIKIPTNELNMISKYLKTTEALLNDFINQLAKNMRINLSVIPTVNIPTTDDPPVMEIEIHHPTEPSNMFQDIDITEVIYNQLMGAREAIEISNNKMLVDEPHSITSNPHHKNDTGAIYVDSPAVEKLANALIKKPGFQALIEIKGHEPIRIERPNKKLAMVVQDDVTEIEGLVKDLFFSSMECVIFESTNRRAYRFKVEAMDQMLELKGPLGIGRAKVRLKKAVSVMLHQGSGAQFVLEKIICIQHDLTSIPEDSMTTE